MRVSRSLRSLANYAHLVGLWLILAYVTDHTPMQLEKYYTCYIKRRLHIPYNPASARLTTGLLMLNAPIQLKIIQY